MNRGFYVPCAPFLYLVPDSGALPGMELQQRSPGPFHYLINEQAKSLVALQELQNEVGALLEFRDLVMDTFPHLRNKMASTVSSSSPVSPPSNIPIPLASSLNTRREWEPGIRVRRKLPPKDLDMSVSSIPRRKPLSSQQPKSGDTSSAGSSAVQDSGFSTETSSSKEPLHSNVIQRVTSPKEVAVSGSGISSTLDEAEDELWNLLDVIHRKGTKLREEVECLQEKLTTGDTEKGARKVGDEGRVFDGGVLCKTSLGGEGGEGLAFIGSEMDGLKERRLQDFKTGGSMRCVMDGVEIGKNLAVETNIKDKLFRNSKLLNGEMGPEDEVRELKFERDFLLDKVSEMEAETLATRAKTSQLKTELTSLVAAKRDLEEQLKTAVTQKCELNTRIHDLHLQFVGKQQQQQPSSDGGGRRMLVAPSPKKPPPNSNTLIRPPSAMHLRSSSVFAPVHPSRLSVTKPSPKTVHQSDFESVVRNVTVTDTETPKTSVVSSPGDVTTVVPSKTVVSESRRGFTCSTTTVLNVRLGTLDGIVSQPSRLPQGVVPDARKIAAILNEFSPVELQRHLLTTTVENQGLQQRLDKSVTSHSDLVLQLDKVKDENDDLRFQLEEKSIELEGTKARVRVLERLHLLKTPAVVIQDTTSSITDMSSSETTSSPKKRPSKIPLGTKSYTAPKPPVAVATGKTPKRDTSLNGKNSVGRNSSSSSLFQKNSLNGGGTYRSKDSLNGGTKRSDSLGGGGKKSCESLTTARMNSSIASNVSNNGKKDSSLGSNKKESSFNSTGSRKTLHRQLSGRGNVTRSNGTVIDQGDSNNSKKAFRPYVPDKVAGDESKKRHSRSSPDSFESSTPRIPTYESKMAATRPWNNSSSSEYFDSITNSASVATSDYVATSSERILDGSASVFNNMPQLHSCSDEREEYFDSSNKHEGLADYDSLELGITSKGGKLILSRNVWVTAESNDQST